MVHIYLLRNIFSFFFLIFFFLAFGFFHNQPNPIYFFEALTKIIGKKTSYPKKKQEKKTKKEHKVARENNSQSGEE